jgi:hypothetical protein
MDDKSETNTRGQIFTIEDDVLVVEHYHFGENVAYEYAEQVRLDHVGQAQMAAALKLAETPAPSILLQLLKERFGTQQAVRDFADAHGVPYERKTDFQP